MTCPQVVLRTGVALQGVVLRHYPRLTSLLKMGLFAVLDNLGYRQVNSWWRTKAYVTFYTRRARWGTIERAGYTKTGQPG